RTHAHRRDGIDLRGAAHVADLARHRATGTGRDDYGREHGSQLAGQRERDDPADHPFGREAPEADDRAHREGHPREEADEPDDERGAGAYEIERDEQLSRTEGRPDGPRERLPSEDERPAEVVEERHEGSADRVDPAGHAVDGPPDRTG